jgi:hypothetical protein
VLVYLLPLPPPTATSIHSSQNCPRCACSSRVLRVLARLCFRSVVVLSFGWAGFGRSTCSGRTVRGCLADSPRAPRGWSVIHGASLEVLLPFSRTVRSSGQTVRGKGEDSPRYPAGQSARPLRTVRPAWPDGPPEPGSFVSWFDSSLLLSCFHVCFKESFLRLEVDP